jgi:MerR family mercuric resistance operon transcriptional regulator
MVDHKFGNGMKRAELANRSGCNLETIRYYEKIGLLKEPPRNDKGYRIYDDGHVRRLRFIMHARELGFSLDEVRALMALSDGSPSHCADVKVLADAHLETVRSRLVTLRKMEKLLADVSSRCGKGKAAACPLIDVLYDAGV